MRFSELYKVVNVIKPADNQAGVAGDSINGGAAQDIMGSPVARSRRRSAHGEVGRPTDRTWRTFHYRLATRSGCGQADAFGDWAARHR